MEIISVIVSCFNNWRTVQLTLFSLEVQTDRCFQVTLADDGSNEAFRREVEQFRATTVLPIEHVWHPDQGFRKASILNKALWGAKCRYLLFTDGDIVLRADWVFQHRLAARRNTFMAGGSHINIPKDLQQRITRSEIQQQCLFDYRWLSDNGVSSARRIRLRLGTYGWRARLLDALTACRDSFVGCSTGCWKEDVERVGGFDETFGYGGEDRDLGIRLANAGVRGVRKRYSFACVHMDHSRPYSDPVEVARCKALLKERRRRGITHLARKPEAS